MENSLAKTAFQAKLSSPPVEIDRLILLARQHYRTEPEAAAGYCRQAIGSLEHISNPTVLQQHQLSESLYLLGKTHQLACDQQSALKALLQSLQIAEAQEDQAAIGERLNLIAMTHAHLKNYSEALSDIYRALAIAQQIPDKQLEGQALNTLGLIYLDLGEPFRALSYIQQSYDILEETGGPELLGEVLNSLCQAYFRLGNPEKALYYGRQAARSSHQRGDFHQYTLGLLALGQVYYAQGEEFKAMEAYQRAYEAAQKYQYVCHASTALCLAGGVLVDRKQFRSAQKNLEESLRLIQNFDQHPNFAECHRLLSELFAKQKKYQPALEHHKQYHASIAQRYQRDLNSRVKVLELANNLETANKISQALKEQNQALREEVRLRKQAQARLEEISRLDPLTKLNNRRYFFELAEREYARSQRYGHALSAIMIDLDYFKQINDTFGHAVGDQVLTEIARRIALSARKVDIAGRYGGEEFIVLLPETSLKDALTVANRIWHDLTHRPTITSKLSIPVKASIGVACLEPGSEISLDELIDRADQALYQAKQLGRNRIEVYLS